MIVNGATYEVTRGTDNNVWFRYNGGGWNPLGGDQSTRTTSPPRIIEWPAGRAMVLVRGLDGEIWYSQVNSGSANFWSPWVRLPAGANAIGAPLPTVITGGLFIDAPNQYRQISVMNLYLRNGVVTSVGGWTVSSHAVLTTNARDIEGDSQIAVYGTERYEAVMRSFITGTDSHVWRVTSTANGTVTGETQVDSGAVCESGVGAARQGNQNTVVSSGQPGYTEQQRVLIACIGHDGYVWESLVSSARAARARMSRPPSSGCLPMLSPSWPLREVHAAPDNRFLAADHRSGDVDSIDIVPVEAVLDQPVRWREHHLLTLVPPRLPPLFIRDPAVDEPQTPDGLLCDDTPGEGQRVQTRE